MSQTKVEAPFVENSRPFRNLIINGDMQIAQRGTSQTGVANNSNEGYNTLDRFALNFFGNEGGAATVSQDTTVPSDTTYGKFSKSIKIDVTTADSSISATGSHSLQQNIEASFLHHSGWDYTNSSSKITLSFWARSVKAGDYHVNLQATDATRYVVAKYTLVANTWKHVEVVIPGNSDLVFNDDNGEGLQVRWMLSAGDDRNDATADTWYNPGSDFDQTTNTQVNFFDSTDNNFFLTGVQLEVGDAATNFEHLPHDVQLHRCRRYLQRVETSGTNSGSFGVGANANATSSIGNHQLNPNMRSVPTLVTSGTASDYSVFNGSTGTDACTSVPAINGAGGTSSQVRLEFISSGNVTAGQATEQLSAGGVETFLMFDAEL